MARLLLARNAQVDSRDSRMRTPLHLACYNGHKTMVGLLLDHGADMCSEDDNQDTPFIVAFHRQYFLDDGRPMIKMML